MSQTIRNRIVPVNTHSHYFLTNNEDMNFKNWLNQEMTVRGMSQAELARLSKVPQPTIQRILSGETPDPRGSTIDKIKGVLGEPPGEYGADVDLIENINLFVTTYRNSTDEGRLFLKNAVKAVSAGFRRDDRRGKHADVIPITNRRKQ